MTPALETNSTPEETSKDRQDTRLILVMRGLRQVAYGLLAVLLGVALAEEGFSLFAIGMLITVSLVGDMVGTYLIGMIADIWGRRRIQALLAVLMAGTGVVFGLTSQYLVLLATALQHTHSQQEIYAGGRTFTHCSLTAESAEPEVFTVITLRLVSGANSLGSLGDYRGDVHFQFAVGIDNQQWKIASICQIISEACSPVSWG